jgi:phosphoribosylamine--glycine ligase
MHYRTDIADKALKLKAVAPPAEAPKLPARFRKPGTSAGGAAEGTDKPRG